MVTERGVVYLMGRVTEREATRAAEIARGVSGVQKVVRVFEVISEAELADMNPQVPSSPPSKRCAQAPEGRRPAAPGASAFRRLSAAA